MHTYSAQLYPLLDMITYIFKVNEQALVSLKIKETRRRRGRAEIAVIIEGG